MRKGLATIHQFLIAVTRDQAGATAIEYALIAAVISAVLIGAMSYLGMGVADLYDGVAANAAEAMN
ncbi:Flp family type IVb pilin [Porphyrobacter sp. LM 6]|uniref:Flp family type IVb pilin n=1 Tax=Porphyrobacter sp. LM 6 TaxID=1896196 RepID=UPI0008471BCE|nr:Flp family type IVb pilin [Porphyrobacter sp. LM 6]AOL93649.1 pilus assembly protein Flp/PilA [Porphyrobacter sp. LM 6]